MREQTSLEVVAPAFLYTDADTTAACLQALFKDSPVATVALDANHRFVTCNRAFENLYRFSHDELVASDLDQLIASPDTRDEASRLSRAVLRGEKVHLVTQRCCKDGTIVDVEINGIPLIVDGSISGVVALYQDVTARNRAQTAYLQLSHKLDILQEERRRVAHGTTAEELAVLNRNLIHLQNDVGDAGPELRVLVQEMKELAAWHRSHGCCADQNLVPAILSTLETRQLSSSVTEEPSAESGKITHRQFAHRALTAREREVLVLLAEGLTSRQIAGRFGISVRTVESHRIHINHKLDFGSLAELVRYAVRHGLIT